MQVRVLDSSGFLCCLFQLRLVRLRLLLEVLVHIRVQQFELLAGRQGGGGRQVMSGRQARWTLHTS